MRTSDVKVCTIGIGDPDAVFGDTFVFAFVRLQTVSNLQ